MLSTLSTSALAQLAPNLDPNTAPKLTPAPGTLNPLCQIAPPNTPEGPEDNLAQRVASALRIESQCARDADFLFQLGTLLSALGQYEDAADRLEGALLYQPDHWPARIEYAIALAGSGDRDAALDLLAQLTEEPRLPEPLRATLSQKRQQLASSAAPEKTLSPTLPRITQSSLAIITGYDNNLLGAPRSSSITLTFPGGNLPATLDPNARPKAGAFTRLDARLDHRHPNSDGSIWQTTLVTYARHTPNHPDTDFFLLGGAIERSHHGQPGFFAQMGGQNLNTDGRDIFRLATLSLGWDHTPSPTGIIGPGLSPLPCRTRLGLETQARDFPLADIQNGRYAGLLAQHHCSGNGWLARLRLGQDLAQHRERPGGDHTRVNVILANSTIWGRHRLNFDFNYEVQIDERGFSPLLENNLRRKINKAIYRLEYTYQNKFIEPFVSIEWLQQRSNLALYQTEGRIALIGLRWLW